MLIYSLALWYGFQTHLFVDTAPGSPYQGISNVLAFIAMTSQPLILCLPTSQPPSKSQLKGKFPRVTSPVIFPFQHLCPFLMSTLLFGKQVVFMLCGLSYQGVQFLQVIPMNPPRSWHMSQAKPTGLSAPEIWILVKLSQGSKIVKAYFFFVPEDGALKNLPASSCSQTSELPWFLSSQDLLIQHLLWFSGLPHLLWVNVLVLNKVTPLSAFYPQRSLIDKHCKLIYALTCDSLLYSTHFSFLGLL